MRNKQIDKLNVKAITEAGEIEHFPRDFFVKKGRKGGKKSAHTASERAKRGWITRKKISTDELGD